MGQAVGILAAALVLPLTSLLASERRGALVLPLSSVLARAERAVGLFGIWWTPQAELDWRISSFVGLAGVTGWCCVVNVATTAEAEATSVAFCTGALHRCERGSGWVGDNPRNAGSRYFFLPLVLLSWLLVYLWRESLLPSPIPLVAGVVVAASMPGVSTTFSRSTDSTPGRLDWEHEIVSCAASSARFVKVPVYYDGSAGDLWSMSMRPAGCRRLAGRP